MKQTVSHKKMREEVRRLKSEGWREYNISERGEHLVRMWKDGEIVIFRSNIASPEDVWVDLPLNKRVYERYEIPK